MNPVRLGQSRDLADPPEELLVLGRRRIEAKNGGIGGHEHFSLTDTTQGPSRLASGL